jgi:CRP/FNR family transcriptional regulator, cyclic AMP receptor protein
VTAARDDAPPSSDRATGRVALLGLDPGLRAAVPDGDLPAAERFLTAPYRELEPGTWAVPTIAVDGEPFAALLVEGLVTHETTIAGRRTADLLGPGDVFRPWRAFDAAIPGTTRWASRTTALVAVLDARFIAAARRWPRLYRVVHDRMADQLDRAAARGAIMGLPRVEQRVLGLFWQLAERWGKVRPEGVVLDLALTHELIGQLVGAQRPTVSLAMRALADEGVLQRTADGAWLLDHDIGGTLPDVGPVGHVHTAGLSPRRARRDRAAHAKPANWGSDGETAAAD